MIAEWCLNEWIKAGKPKPWYIVEIGPNRGALSDELLRVNVYLTHIFFRMFENLKCIFF